MNKTNWQERVEQLKRDIYVLYLALKSPKVPWYAKAFIGIVVGYALSPIDLIPDFIPVLGYLDDMILLPVGIILALKLIPAEMLDELRATARTQSGKRKSWGAGIVIILIWLLLIGLILSKVVPFI